MMAAAAEIVPFVRSVTATARHLSHLQVNKLTIRSRPTEAKMMMRLMTIGTLLLLLVCLLAGATIAMASEVVADPSDSPAVLDASRPLPTDLHEENLG
ncbi:MAG: hypothetical protein ABWY00_09315 [Dongiaceae bacterium]